MLLISLKNAVNSIPVTDEDLQLMSKDTTQATRCFFCRFEKSSFFLSHRKEKWWEMKMRQTKKEAIPKEASLVGLRNIHVTFQTAFRLIVQYIPCCKKMGRRDVCFGSE